MFYTYIIFVSIYFLIYSWLPWVFIASRFSLVAVSGVFFIVVRVLLIVMPSLVAEHGLQQLRYEDSVVAIPRLQSTGSIVVGHGLSCFALHVGSSRIRDQTCISCFSRQTLPLSHQGDPCSNFFQSIFFFPLNQSTVTAVIEAPSFCWQI